MHKFVRNLLTEWRRLRLPFENKNFVAAVSGGADSVALLLALDDLHKRKKLKNRFVIAHFNHNLRAAESEADAEFVKSLCVKFGFELVLKTGSVARTGNLEQNARVARYEFLRETARTLRADAVLTAHTVNDQAETFLINLIRGSGLHGLSAMKTVRVLEKAGDEGKRREGEEEKRREGAAEFDISEEETEISAEESFTPLLPFSPSPLLSSAASPLLSQEIMLVRPLLSWATRADTENFCRETGVAPRYDTMNEDLAFKRVRIRKILLPMLEDFNPKIVETLAKTANLLREELEHAENTSPTQKPTTENRFLMLKELKTLSKSALYTTLREWLEFNRGNLRGLELKHIAAIEGLIFSRKSGRTIELPAGEKILRSDGKLLFVGKNNV